mmetsp:Transcript_20244/g.34135  ORF Transcript_20244/g.34135 Transcript_20244/m.34135 type:complete len:1344 (-) Transcript_20244:174-4205(-)
MSITVDCECWAWISKRGDDSDSLTFETSKFKKRKKRWITVTDNTLIYSKTAKRSDMKYVQLEHMTAIKTFNESNLETMVWLIDSQTRIIQAVLEPENFSRDVPLILDSLLRACTHRRRGLTQKAIIANDITGLKHILAYHTLAEAVLQDVNFSSYGTPLHFLVQNPGCISCLPFLVDRGALVDSPNAQGLLPVHTAVQGGELAVLQRMVEVAAWPLDQGGGGVPPDVLVNLKTSAPDCTPDQQPTDSLTPPAVDRTPLHLSSDEEITALLIRHGARLEDQDSEGNTPFLLACSRGLYLHAIELLDSGAAVNQANWCTGLTPIMLVISCCNKLSTDETQQRDEQAEEDMHSLFSDLMDRNADCSVADNKQMSALHYACRQGDLAICSTLLRAGADLDTQSSSGATPLCLAASVQSAAVGTSSFELCGLLMSKGSYPRIRDQKGRQALHYAAGAGNAETLSLLLDVSHGQDVNILCFSGYTALDYVHKVLAWLENDDLSLEIPSFVDDFNLKFSRSDASRRKWKQKYIKSEAVLKKFGALERTNANISVEQNCRDMTFTSAKSGAYSIATATPYAALVRLTSFLFYSKAEADLFLLSYKSFIGPSELLKLFKVRFYMLTNLPEKAVSICDDLAFQNGTTFQGVEVITLQLQALEAIGQRNSLTTAKNSGGTEDGGAGEEDSNSNSNSSGDSNQVNKSETGILRRNSFARKRGESIGTKDSAGYIKGMETSVQPADNNDVFSVHNICFGKPSCSNDGEILPKLLECLNRCFDGIEMISNCLVLRGSGRYFLFENVSVLRDFKGSTSWSCILGGDCSQGGDFFVPGVAEAQAPCKINSLSLRCKPAPKMMRGKAVFELQISFSNVMGPCAALEDDVISTIKDELCLTCAKVLYGFACDAFSPNIPLLRPRLLTSKSTIDVFEEATEMQSRGEMEALQACERQVSILENEFNQSEGGGESLGMSNKSMSASNNAFLQLLSLWCKDFYEDDFENDATFRLEMGEFIEDVFLVSGEAIENELDPNCFAPFLGLQSTSIGETLESVSPSSESPPKKIHQNKRESKAIRQSKRLSSKGMIESIPCLRGGIYECLSYFDQQSFFDQNGKLSTKDTDFRILSCTPQVFAEQWTLLEHFLFSKVKRSDFLESDDLPGSNFSRLKQFQWHMMDLCISQIVESSSIDDVKSKISFLLDVSAIMESFRNFNGMFEIYTVLQTTSVFRLKEAWSALKKPAAERAEIIKGIFNTTDSFAKYRSYVLKYVDLYEKPTVPYLGIYMKDLVHLKQLPSAAGKRGLVNMAKMTSLSSKLLDLHTFQQIPYRFSPDFLVIAGMFSRPRMGTEEEQYQASIQLCPL